MLKENVVLSAPAGFHARPASQFVKLATDSGCEVELTCGDNTVNGKSIMGILTLGASSGSEVTVSVEGENEVETLKTLVEFLKVME